MSFNLQARDKKYYEELAKKNGKFDGSNPCLSVVKYPEKKIKMRMSNEDVEKILQHCESKAFDGSKKN